MKTIALFAALGLAACDWRQQDEDFTEQDLQLIEQLALEPVAQRSGVRARLGQQLFFDTELSGPIVTSHAGQRVPLTDTGSDGGALTTGRVSCADCHQPGSWFSDDRSSPNNVSLGVQWSTRNSPSLVNVAHYVSTFAWDGRGTSLAEQSKIAYVSPRTMAGSPGLLARVVMRKYADVWADAGLTPLDAGQVFSEDGGVGPGVNAIANDAYTCLEAYLTRLESGDAPVDRFARGDRTALSQAQRRGLKLFIGKANCVECHKGPTFSDNRYHALGVAQRGEHVPEIDNGRFDGLMYRSTSPVIGCGSNCEANDLSNVGLFRTKSLRQVAETAPYMHAGQLATLAEVVHFYNLGGDPSGFTGARSKVVVPLELTSEEEGDLVAFLGALTGAPVSAELRCDSARPGSVHRYEPRCAETP
ncbi:MAG: hypothetical protein IPJ65_36440 [Archangiaceae bacterium]|nr:hypothetical protein [Archangiaceae bacterium]